jgi:hypothetical protein
LSHNLKSATDNYEFFSQKLKNAPGSLLGKEKRVKANTQHMTMKTKPFSLKANKNPMLFLSFSHHDPLFYLVAAKPHVTYTQIE